MPPCKVGYLVGSLATQSINRKLAKALVRLAPPELQLSEIFFRDLPIYSYDYDANFPPAARRGQGDRPVHREVPAQLHGRVARFPGQGVHRAAEGRGARAGEGLKLAQNS